MRPRNRVPRRARWILVSLAAWSAGCPDAERRRPEAASASVRRGVHVVRSLLREAGRAELDSNGLWINLGTPDQHKYTRGGWLSGWGANRAQGSATSLEAGEHSAVTFFDPRGGVRAIVLRARCGRPGHVSTIEIEGRGAKPAAIPTTWGVVEHTLPEPTTAGPFTLRLLSGPLPEGERVQVDWIWLKRGNGSATLPQKVGVLSLGEPRRALLASPPRTFSFYLEVPSRAALVLDYGARKPTQFAVTATADGEAPRPLFRASASDGRWHETRVDLGALAGRVVRLDLTTSGEAGEAGWGEPEIVRPGPPPAVPPIPPGRHARNLIHVLADAARQDAYPPFNPASPVRAPAVERLARGGVVFPGAYVAAPWTLPSVATILSGRYFGTFMENSETAKVPDQVPLFPEHLKRHGFTTAAFVANPYLQQTFGFARGWDELHNFAQEKRPTEGEFLFDDAIRWLQQLARRKPPRRFYLYIHTMEPHDPYTYRERLTPRLLGGKPYTGKNVGKVFSEMHYRQLEQRKVSLTEEDQRYVRALYASDIELHEIHFQRLLMELERLELLSSTLVVFSNDHGEEMFDRGHVDHGGTMYEEVLRSPLVLHHPPLLPAGRSIPELVELVDLVPTALELLGLPALPGTHGLSLRPLLHGDPSGSVGYALSDGPARAVRVGPFKLIQYPVGQKLFDVVQDRGEQRDLAASHPIARRATEIYLGEGAAVPFKARRLTSLESGEVVAKQRVVLDPELQKQLKALGYLE